jgi:hypothetical protein
MDNPEEEIVESSPLDMDDAEFEEQFAQMMANEGAEHVLDKDATFTPPEEEKAQMVQSDSFEEAPASEEEVTDVAADPAAETENSSDDDGGDENVDGGQESGEPIDLSTVLEPFQANGSTMKVNNAEEAIHLMQMGANYTKKMQSLKPNLTIMKALEKAGLLSQEKINHLIDLATGDSGAINKLIKDKEIDPMTIGETEGKDYVPSDHSVSAGEIELDEVIDRIKHTPTYATTVDVVTKEWDVESKTKMLAEPRYIESLNQQMESGVYQQVQSEVTRARALGQLNGVSDFQAYNHIGQLMMDKGALTGVAPRQPTPAARTVKPNVGKANDPARNNRRKAAAPTKGQPAQSRTKRDFNPLALSDEEFEKLNLDDFI